MPKTLEDEKRHEKIGHLQVGQNSLGTTDHLPSIEVKEERKSEVLLQGKKSTSNFIEMKKERLEKLQNLNADSDFTKDVSVLLSRREGESQDAKAQFQSSSGQIKKLKQQFAVMNFSSQHEPDRKEEGQQLLAPQKQVTLRKKV
mmetsp:Transcript_41213/g.30296  ORF Transcript_41213/g.30296 Transcript_41213/m.30296 type:complete len:144 (+) Transcript_41213:353-784(+)